MFRIEKIAFDIRSDMLIDFHHRQIINKKYVFQTNEWKVIESNELREWSKDKRIWLTEYLRQLVSRGGTVLGAYDNDVLVGFCSVDGKILGKTAKYVNLTMLFVDDEYKRKGIGKTLFEEICKYASLGGADKMFISAIPSIDTIDFYFNMGCMDASEVVEEFVDSENDRYLEYLLI